ncbi:MAG: co-chaperone GroES [Bacteroidota bacterium]|nr:co-chaperone GroES [Bacteroidota bacterium]
MNIKPLSDRIIVKPAEAEEKTASGLIIPDTAKEKPMKGEVIAVGAGKVSDDGKLTKMELKVGDKILYGKYSGTEVVIEGTEYLIMRESDVYGVI